MCWTKARQASCRRFVLAKLGFESPLAPPLLPSPSRNYVAGRPSTVAAEERHEVCTQKKKNAISNEAERREEGEGERAREGGSERASVGGEGFWTVDIRTLHGIEWHSYQQTSPVLWRHHGALVVLEDAWQCDIFRLMTCQQTAQKAQNSGRD